MNENRCVKCKSITTCITAMLDNNVCRCIHFGELTKMVDELVDKFSSIGHSDPLNTKES